MIIEEREFNESIECEYLFIGAGVTGLAIARELSKYQKSIILIDENASLGSVTSSRNSEVIHAGIYYAKDSLKHSLCIEGRRKLLDYLQSKRIKYNLCGKVIFASNFSEINKLESIKNHSDHSGIPMRVISKKEINEMSEIIKAKEALFSPNSGIFDSHAFIHSLAFDACENGAVISLNNKCREIKYDGNLFMSFCESFGEKFKIKSRYVVNCAGLSALDILKSLEPKRMLKFTNYYVKGHYYSYSTNVRLDKLYYPVPDELGLGVHLTIDLAGNMRFGPDTVICRDSDAYHSEVTDDLFYKKVIKNFVNIDKNKLCFSYSGIRPKVREKNHVMRDFMIDQSCDKRLFSLIAIESPGLTSSLALGDHLVKIINE